MPACPSPWWDMHMKKTHTHLYSYAKMLQDCDCMSYILAIMSLFFSACFGYSGLDMGVHKCTMDASRLHLAFSLGSRLWPCYGEVALALASNLVYADLSRSGAFCFAWQLLELGCSTHTLSAAWLVKKDLDCKMQPYRATKGKHKCAHPSPCLFVSMKVLS